MLQCMKSRSSWLLSALAEKSCRDAALHWRGFLHEQEEGLQVPLERFGDSDMQLACAAHKCVPGVAA
jgi:hypothetical protein